MDYFLLEEDNEIYGVDPENDLATKVYAIGWDDRIQKVPLSKYFSWSISKIRNECKRLTEEEVHKYLFIEML